MSNDRELEAAEKDPGYVYFVSSAKPSPGEAREHAGIVEYLFPRKAEDVKRDWGAAIDQVVEVVSQNIDKAPKGYRMDQVEVGLGFSAKGQLAFIAEAGVESSIKIVFKQLAQAGKADDRAPREYSWHAALSRVVREF